MLLAFIFHYALIYFLLFKEINVFKAKLLKHLKEKSILPPSHSKHLEIHYDNDEICFSHFSSYSTHLNDQLTEVNISVVLLWSHFFDFCHQGQKLMVSLACKLLFILN